MVRTAAGLLDPQIQRCPYPLYKKLRAEKPVSFMTDLGMYYVASYQLGRQILTDPRQFLNGTTAGDGRIFVEPSEAAQKILREKNGALPLTPFTTTNGAEHRGYRAVVELAFKVSSIRKMESFIASLAAELVESIAHAGECEVVSKFTMPLPTFVIADMLGIPRSNYDNFKKWSDAVLTYVALTVPEEQAVAGAESLVEMHHYMADLLRQRRKEPRDDLLTIISQAKYMGERPLSDLEAVSMIMQILVAGNETTTNSLGVGLEYLATNPSMQTTLRERPELLPKFVEEVLRISTPLQVVLRRTIADISLGGVDIPAESLILISLGSANADECKFAQAETINLERPTVGAHLTFGSGPHHCIGAELARLEMRESFRAWISRFSHIELAQPRDSIEYRASWVLRGPVSLRLQYH